MQSNLKQILLNTNYTRLLDHQNSNEETEEKMNRDTIKKLKGAFGHGSNLNLNMLNIGDNELKPKSKKKKDSSSEEEDENDEEFKRKRLQPLGFYKIMSTIQ